MNKIATPRAQAAAAAFLALPAGTMPAAWTDYDGPEAGDPWQLLRAIANDDPSAFATLANCIKAQASHRDWINIVSWSIPDPHGPGMIDLEEQP